MDQSVTGVYNQIEELMRRYSTRVHLIQEIELISREHTIFNLLAQTTNERFIMGDFELRLFNFFLLSVLARQFRFLV